jgi:hypothetical protein
MPAKKLLVFSVCLLIISGVVLAGQTIIQKGSIVTDIFNATGLFVEKISGYQLKGDIDASGNKVANLVDPVNPQDAATKDYVDSLAGEAGLKCDGVDTLGGSTSGDNWLCGAKEGFQNIKKYGPIGPIKYGAMVAADNNSAAQWCREQGYSGYLDFLGIGNSRCQRAWPGNPLSPLINCIADKPEVCYKNNSWCFLWSEDTPGGNKATQIYPSDCGGCSKLAVITKIMCG